MSVCVEMSKWDFARCLHISACMSEYQCVAETKAGADRRHPLRCSPSLEGACTCNEDPKCVTNSLGVCKHGGGKWDEFVSCSSRTGHLSDSAPFSFHSSPARTSMKLLALLSLLILMLQEILCDALLCTCQVHTFDFICKQVCHGLLSPLSCPILQCPGSAASESSALSDAAVRAGPKEGPASFCFLFFMIWKPGSCFCFS